MTETVSDKKPDAKDSTQDLQPDSAISQAPHAAKEASVKPSKKPKKDSMLANLLLNIVIPTLILTKFSGEKYLGPQLGVVIALAFPVIYGIRDFARNHKVNMFSALGFVSVLLTGTMALLKLDPQFIAIKEAAIPGLIGIATLFSINTRFPLVKTFLYNDTILKVEKITAALKHYDAELAFEKTLRNASYLVAGSFFLSSVLNYGLAKYLLVSPPGSEAFNEELGKMTAMSFPVIAVPMTIFMIGAMFYFFRSINKLTHLTLEDIINDGSDTETIEETKTTG